MPKFTSMSPLLQDDKVFLKEVFDGTRYKLMETKEGLYALTYGESKNKQGLYAEIEAELASIGVYIVTTTIYWEVV